MAKDPGSNHKIAVVITSCDRYRDLWKPFFTLFNRFWPDCPYPRYLVTDEARDFTGFKATLQPGGAGISWSKVLKNALTAIPEEYLLLLVEDLFLKAPVNNSAVVEAFQWGIQNDANCIKMNSTPGPDAPLDDPRMAKKFGLSTPGTLYRASSVFTFWKKQTLIDLLDDRELPWAFEVHGTERSDHYPRFYASRNTHFPNYNGVIKGLWRGYVIKRLEKLGIEPDLRVRPVMNIMQETRLALMLARSAGLRLLPAHLQRDIKRVFLRGKFNYRMAIK